MLRRRLIVACCVLLVNGTIAAPLSAQATDPITGTWAGDIGLTDTNRHLVTFDLKFDGAGAVSGTIVNGPGPAKFKLGSFDPKTGGLRIEVAVDDGTPAPFVFEGVAVNGVATGRVSGNGQTGTFKLTRKAADVGVTPAGGAADAVTALRHGFGEVSEWVTKSADLVPAARYTYRPAPTVRTFGELVAHVADSYHYYCGRAAGKNVEWSDAIEKGKTDKATVVQKLKEATDVCTAGFGAAMNVEPMVAAVGHTSLHYGNVVTYVRMLGLVPPSTK
jgi:DinB family protein